MISRASTVTGRDLRDASASRDENGRPNVHFNLTGEGRTPLRVLYPPHINDFLAVVLDNKVQEVARINSESSATPARSPALQRAARISP